MITKDNFLIEYSSTYLTFRPSTAKTHADYVHVCSRDKVFHKWTCAKVRDKLIKLMNFLKIPESCVDRPLIEELLEDPMVKDYITANVPSWMVS